MENRIMPPANRIKFRCKASTPDEKKPYNRAIVVSRTKVTTVMIIRTNMYVRELDLIMVSADVINNQQSGADLDKDYFSGELIF